MFLMMLAVLLLYGGYLISPNFSANQVRSLFRIGYKSQTVRGVLTPLVATL